MSRGAEPPSPPPDLPPSPAHHEHLVAFYIIFGASGLGLILLLGLTIWLVLKRRPKRRKSKLSGVPVNVPMEDKLRVVMGLKTPQSVYIPSGGDTRGNEGGIVGGFQWLDDEAESVGTKLRNSIKKVSIFGVL